MKTIQFKVSINAPASKVWAVLWNDSTYRLWTAAFSEGSYAVSDWKEGSKILFLNEEKNGIYSTITRLIPEQFISFTHIGNVKNGVEQPIAEEAKKCSGDTENYTLTETGNTTELVASLDITEDFSDYFSRTFPKALNIVKELAEQ